MVRENDPANVDIFDKLSMAYMKSGRMESAERLIKQGVESGHLEHVNGQILSSKLESMQNKYHDNFGSTRNQEECKSLLATRILDMKNEGSYNQLKDFCAVMSAHLDSFTQPKPSGMSGKSLPVWFVDFDRELNLAQGEKEIDHLKVKYNTIKHPHIDFSLGVKYFEFDNLESAYYHFCKAALIGLLDKSLYWDTIFANSVGSSIAILFTSNLINRDQNNLNDFNLFLNGYMFLSSSVRTFGNKAFEALSNRASMIMNCAMGAKFMTVMKHGSLREVVVISDYYRSYLGSSEFNLDEFSIVRLMEADKVHQWFKTIKINNFDQSKFTMEDYVPMGERIHDAVFDKIAPEFFEGYPVSFPPLTPL